MYNWASQVARVVKNLPANAGDIRDSGSIPGWGRSPEEGNGNPLRYSCLENPRDGGAWWAAVYGVTQSRTRLKQLSSSSSSSSSSRASLVTQMVKESACNVGDLGSISGLGRFPWRKKWQPIPVFLPEKFHGQRSLAGYSP